MYYQLCPVCGGRGVVPWDFYHTRGEKRSPEDEITIPTECRTCRRRGIIEVSAPYPYTPPYTPPFPGCPNYPYDKWWYWRPCHTETTTSNTTTTCSGHPKTAKTRWWVTKDKHPDEEECVLWEGAEPPTLWGDGEWRWCCDLGNAEARGCDPMYHGDCDSCPAWNVMHIGRWGQTSVLMENIHLKPGECIEIEKPYVGDEAPCDDRSEEHTHIVEMLAFRPIHGVIKEKAAKQGVVEMRVSTMLLLELLNLPETIDLVGAYTTQDGKYIALIPER